MHCMRAQLRESRSSSCGVPGSARADGKCIVNDNGSVVNASSIAGLVGFAKNAAYAAAKVSQNSTRP